MGLVDHVYQACSAAIRGFPNADPAANSKIKPVPGAFSLTSRVQNAFEFQIL